jgi:hypothetical protein
MAKKRNVESIDKITSQLITDKVDIDRFAREQIVTLETAKVPYQEASKNLDLYLLESCQEVNTAYENVEKSYQKRIDAGGASDLFWRIVGVSSLTSTTPNPNTGPQTKVVGVSYELRCERLSRTYDAQENVGSGSSTFDFNPSSVQIYLGREAGIGDQQPLTSAGSDMDSVFKPVNLHGIKIDIEPYSRDVLETYVNVSIGTADLGGTRLFLGEIYDDIEIGQLVSSEPQILFPDSGVNIVTGVGTAIANLTGIPNTSGVNGEIVTYVDLRDPVTQLVTAPLFDGQYPTFTFSISPDQVSDSISVGERDSPYELQQVKKMVASDAGTGVEVEYDNSGVEVYNAEWPHFMDGYPDPKNVSRIIREPKVGSGKVYYPIGFDRKPLKASGGNAAEGDTRTISEYISTFGGFFDPNSPQHPDFVPAYSSQLNNTPEIDAEIKSNETEALQKESSLKYNDEFYNSISLANKIKKEYNDFNIRIWAYRVQIGKAKQEKLEKEEFKTLINNDTYKPVANTGGPPVVDRNYPMSSNATLMTSTVLTFDITV